ncbi:extracellular solute-binding protein [Paenibacillus sp. PAMC21692]|uniref:extracellular solute-binding protein n=1 Tax=Paenibacillus sp. PAMC21692 TaxID=2762320 RepID=UPI00164E8D4D|nr:extracellular solute-binding protein [Paenibacillus sp. PAMC21692]QNK56999.1 extracellular solute-binding protein [Paenibacillus sp. PAMC21692]
MEIRKTKRGRFIPIACMIALTGALLAGCAGKNENNPGASAAPEQTTTPQQTQQTDTKEEPFKLSLMLMQYAPEAIKDDSPILKALEEATNTDLDITWVPQAQIDEKTNLILASGDLPQLMYIQSFKSPSILNAAKAGAFWEIGPSIQDYPNLSRANAEIMNNIRVDGKNYALYKYAPPAQVGVAYRQDWLKNVGLETPKTVDEFYNMLKAFKTMDPDQDGQDDTYGMAYYKESFLAMFRIVSLWFGSPNIWGEDASGNLTPDFMTDGYMASLQFMKKLYDEQLINQDFAVVTNGTANDMLLDGSAGALFASSGSLSTWQADARIAEQNGEIGIIGTVDGGHGLRARAGTGYIGTYMIPKKSVETEEEFDKVMAFLDKLNSQEVQDLLLYGIEGRHYTKENGLVVKMDNVPESQQLGAERGDLNILHVGVVANETPSKLLPIEQKRDQLRAENEKVAVYNLVEPYLSDTYSKQGQQLDNMRYDMMVKFVMGQIDEAGYKAEVDKWLQAGGSAVIKEFNDQYQANK